MKNRPILRYFVLGVFVHGALYFLGVVLFPIYFPLKRIILKYETPFLMWFLNTDEKDYISNIYGDENYRNLRNFDYDNASIFRKVWEGFIWLAIRNSHYWFRLNVLPPNIGVPYNIEVIKNDTTPLTNGMTFCNYEILGVQYAKYWVGDKKYFRYSFTIPTPKIMQWLGFNNMWNVHSGWAETRWIFKNRFFNNNKNIMSSKTKKHVGIALKVIAVGLGVLLILWFFGVL